MIEVAADGLDRLDSIAPAVQGLGRWHGRYGVVDSHYGTAASALLYTLRQNLEAEFTSTVKEA